MNENKKYTITAVYQDREIEIMRTDDGEVRDKKYFELLQLISAVGW